MNDGRLTLSGLIARARSLWQGAHRGSTLHAEMEEEFRLHQELRAADLVRSGMSEADAARQARLEFGSTEHYKDRGRESRGLRGFDDLRVSWLDFKLGFRMLVKYPGLTLVGGLAIAFAIWVGAGAFELVTQAIRPTLPLPEGDRIVGLHNWDAATSRVERRALHDFFSWRQELRSVRDLGAFRDVDRNLITGEGHGEPITVAEISASAFRLTRVPPLLGRALVEADEHPGAPPVVVIGYDAWQSRFGGDSGVVGRTVRLGDTRSTIVGVMPSGFAFPVRHSFWTPLRLNILGHKRREGPAIRVFARLAPGVTRGEAQVELTALGQRAAADFKDTHEHLRPQVMPYARSTTDPSEEESLALMSINLPVVMLLALICANVALLMFARAATREGEIIVRTALGATRGRIITQLFAEALVLGGVAAVVGLSAASFGLRLVMDVIAPEMSGGRLPFWFHASLSPATLLYAGVLTVLSAVIAGVVPALKVTRGLGTRLKQATAGGGGLKFGGLWTAVIVSQVALTLAFPAIAFMMRRETVRIRTMDVGFPAKEYLSARLAMDREPSSEADTTQAIFAARFAKTYQELRRRVMADPAVIGITFADWLPRLYPRDRFIAVDEGGAAPSDPGWPGWYRVSAASVDREFFDVLGTPILSGRGFHSGDLESGSQAVIVNQSLVTMVLGNRNPIGRRIRYANFVEWHSGRPTLEVPSPWYEIVGVVRDMAMGPVNDPAAAGFYLPIGAGGVRQARVAVHVRGDPAAFAPRLRALGLATDPTLRLYEVQPLDRVDDAELLSIGFWFRMVVAVSAMALMLSLAGIYSVMAFTVARRTREIGIRVALGGNRRSILLAIFRRPLVQVGLGIAAGATLVTGVMLLGTGGLPSVKQVAAVVMYAGLMLGVCLLACVVPTRRALRVEPTEALRAEG